MAISKIVKTVNIYGPTDYMDALISSLHGKKVFRSDYLGKLKEALDNPEAEGSKKYIKDFVKLPQENISAASGYDEDHPFVTKEGGKFRAWRYVALSE